MIAELPASEAHAPGSAADREPLSIDRVAADLQLILAARRATRNAESAGIAHVSSQGSRM